MILQTCAICGEQIIEEEDLEVGGHREQTTRKRYCSELCLAEAIRRYWERLGFTATVVFERVQYLGCIYKVARLITVGRP